MANLRKQRSQETLTAIGKCLGVSVSSDPFQDSTQPSGRSGCQTSGEETLPSGCGAFKLNDQGSPGSFLVSSGAGINSSMVIVLPPALSFQLSIGEGSTSHSARSGSWGTSQWQDLTPQHLWWGSMPTLVRRRVKRARLTFGYGQSFKTIGPGQLPWNFTVSQLLSSVRPAYRGSVLTSYSYL